jgi:hypothetical protein
MSQISTLQGKSQQASLENIQSHYKERRRKQVRDKTQEKRVACTGNIDGPAVGKGTGISTPTQHSVNSHPNYNAASDWGIIMDKLQAPSQVNQLLSQGSTFFHELGGTCNAQNHSRAMQLYVQTGGTAPNNANHMSSWTPNPNPAQEIVNEVQAPADHNWTERRIGGHDPNELVHNNYNGGQLPSTQFPIDLRGVGETHMAGLPLMTNQVLETYSAGVQNNPQNRLNGGQPIAGLNDTHLYQENDNPLQQSGKAFNEFWNIEIEGETEKQQQDVISEMEGHTNGERDEGSVGVTNEEVGRTNIVGVDAEARGWSVLPDAADTTFDV